MTSAGANHSRNPPEDNHLLQIFWTMFASMEGRLVRSKATKLSTGNSIQLRHWKGAWSGEKQQDYYLAAAFHCATGRVPDREWDNWTIFWLQYSIAPLIGYLNGSKAAEVFSGYSIPLRHWTSTWSGVKQQNYLSGTAIHCATSSETERE